MPTSDFSSYDQLDPGALRHDDSYKWTKYAPDVLPFWIADMDFPVAPAIVAALHERLSRGLGYHQVGGDPTLKALLLGKLAADGLSGLEAQHISFLPGVVPGLYAAVLALTQPGDEVITFTPIYPPFLTAAGAAGRIAREVPLARTEQGYQLDWQALEQAVTPRSKLLMLCHPHNPTGRVWTADELSQLADFALRHNLYVVSDELHADLRYSDAIPYQPFATVNPALMPRVVMLTGPCKAYNTAGLGIGAMICSDTDVLRQLDSTLAGVSAPPSALSVTMWQAALRHGSPWLSDTVQYLQQNRDLVTEFMARRLPQVPYFAPQATYLAWLDLRGFAQADHMQQYLLEEAKIALNDGPTFGQGYQGFVRLNFATRRNLLQEGLDRLAAALRS